MDTVRTWRDRFAAGGLPALANRKRSGRPRSLRCRLPRSRRGSSVPRRDRCDASRWSCPELWSPGPATGRFPFPLRGAGSRPPGLARLGPARRSVCVRRSQKDTPAPDVCRPGQHPTTLNGDRRWPSTCTR
ncbi:helix-turn-helix domain-containing protein [Streptomyces lydicus]|nr:helix-turn-helix domain-containing protein [Streptomyces lydicus]MCZ1012315.1 helix-turn-helix domain-containing protein [Streptomyces lydicus]